MLTNFMHILNFFLVLSLHFNILASQSGDYEFLGHTLDTDSKDLRQERIDARVCEDWSDVNDQEQNDFEWDLCFPKQFIAPNETHCMCDEFCGLYKDCCADNLQSEDIPGLILPKSDSCIQLFSNGNAVVSVYGINHCDDKWIETSVGIKEKCELDVQQFESTTGATYSYLQDIPVLSERYIYRNMFCAVCNHDSNHLKPWNISVDCDGFLQDTLKDLERDISPKDYNPLTKKWKVFLKNNQSINCSIGVKQFKDKHFLTENNLRKCKKTIDECPEEWTDKVVSHKCESYASYIYEDNEVYKNFHCALCNGVSTGFMECSPNSSLSRAYAEKTLWFPLLLDFNFAGDKGEWVGGQKKCPKSGQLYDPVYDKCITINRCNSSDNECLLKGWKCSAIAVLENKKDFEILENNSIYLKHQKSILNETEYEFEDQNKTKLKICRNESELMSDLTQSPFEAGWGQILMSEISLYTSIFCLTLHLMIYIFVPKLRNLPGKNLMSLSSALLLGHISFVTAAYLRADRRGIVCVLIAIITHYSYLAAFFWMLIMALDICKTFRRTKGRRSKGSNRYKFLKYSLFGWLSPAFIVILSTAFDIALEGSKFRPLYGHRFCWISQRQALLVFFALPVFIIVCLNVVLFSLTAIGLVQTQEETKILNKKSDKVRYLLYIKLAFIMGLTWAFGFAASLTSWKVLWYPFILLNGLQGTAIFLAFSCKRKVFSLLATKLGIRKGYDRSTTSSDVIRSATATSLPTSTLVPSSPDSNVTKIKFTK